MKPLLIVLSGLILAGNTTAETNEIRFPLLPLVPSAAISNAATVRVYDLLSGIPCPPETTNLLSNTNIIDPSKANQLRAVLAKYSRLGSATNVPGARLVSCYSTNLPLPKLQLDQPGPEMLTPATQDARVYVFEGKEQVSEIRTVLPFGLKAETRDSRGTGYDLFVHTVRPGNVELMYEEVRQHARSGLAAGFTAFDESERHWSWRQTDFTNAVLTQLRQRTNGMLIGRCLLWDVWGKLLLDAEFRNPYKYQPQSAQ